MSLEDSAPGVEVAGSGGEQRDVVSIACPAISFSPTRSLPRLTDPPPIAGGVLHITLCIASGVPHPFPLYPFAFISSRRFSHDSGVSPSWLTCAFGVANFCSTASSSCPRLWPGWWLPLWSWAPGVGHDSVVAVSVRSPSLRLWGIFSASLALGVGQVCAAAWRSPPPELSRPSSRFRSALSPPPVIVRGVGQSKDEQPQPLVRRANFLRRKESRRNSVAEALEIGANSIEAERQVSGDILEEHECGLNLRNDPSDRGPKVSLIILATALSGGAERLARVAAADEIHRSTPRAAVEGSHIRPHRSRSHEARVHRRDQTADAERFPLHIAHPASTAAEREIESDVEPAASGAEGEDCDVFGV